MRAAYFNISVIGLMGFLTISSFFTSVCTAQDLTVRGTVVDGESLERLLGVHIKNTSVQGVTSDIDGNFSIHAEVGDTLEFTMIGYKEVQMVLKDSLEYESMIISMKPSPIILDDLNIYDYYKANTIIELPERQVYQVPGIEYPEKTEEDDYRLGVGEAIVSPVTAIYQLFSKEHKQLKRLYDESKENKEYEENYEEAKTALYAALDALGDKLDEYYMIDFLQFVGLTLESTARRSTYELVKILPGEVDRFYDHLHVKLEDANSEK